ncbi:MAG: flagellar hook protein FlgE [Gammaproteobacteria bacterium]|nr:flagellar hook protein FlgE [Gammaproteobacteria bacterium]MBU0884944.1 flagellar hook protein FlgE [Gammaproteobacteria bacterium]MBU0901144.1 flagellar hook protein FlgE [Gammaproteobacteria bacterium]MBU1859564.1 flagellar hook protein FlgE [Gammaproteobacteria bacterium]
MGFNIGLSGLRAATSDLNVTGNNIANAGTAGFKQSRAEFADVYAASVLGSGKNAQGSGVLLADVSQQFNQGNINYTQNSLDLAINGNGFFMTSNNGEISYTRAGYFGTDRDGYMVNNFGQRLQGYSADANGNLLKVQSDLQVKAGQQEPKATTSIVQSLNLNSTNVRPANAETNAAPVFDPSDPLTYNSSTSTNIYDAQGNPHVMTQYFVKNEAPANNGWVMHVLVDGVNPRTPASTQPFSYGLAFDTSGQLADPALTPLASAPADPLLDAPAITSPNGTFSLAADDWTPAEEDPANPGVKVWNGAQNSAMTFDMRSSTQYAATFGVNSISQDGYTTGQLSGLEIDDTGVIFARYTNGQSKIQGQVLLANFANVQGLTPVGKTAWVQSFESGEPVVGTPRSTTLGALQSGALEDSNVELSDQLVNLIVAQRNYQANAKTIETESAITQTIINLR